MVLDGTFREDENIYGSGLYYYISLVELLERITTQHAFNVFFYFPHTLSCKDKKKSLMVLSNHPSRLRDKKQRTHISKAISLLETH